MYWMMLYSAINLKTQKEVMRAARPSLSKQQTFKSQLHANKNNTADIK